ncbi:MAG: precorrin-6y C5,15-methyltransferase (decarboxylating) subunit CbiE [Thermodesulfobacteriota bacterium]
MIYVIGIGVQGRESLGKRALGIISRSGLLAGGRRHIDEFPAFGGGKVEIKGGLSNVASAIDGFLSGGGKTAVVLATGDPLFFGIAGFMIKRFAKRKVEVIPNVSTVAEAFARIKEGWAGAKVVSVHGRDRGLQSLCAEAATHDRLAVFTDPVNTPARIAAALLERGLTGFTAHVCEALGTRDERVSSGSLEKVAARKGFHPLNIMILLRKNASPVPAYRTGIPDGEFAHTGGMITKEEIRVITLSKLGVVAGSVLWDIGAGCGSVAVEAAHAARPATVYAVEKNRGRVKEIRENRKRFGAFNLEVVEGVAPRCIIDAKLPAPDAVFAGGGGAGLSGILRYSGRRLKKGGRLVVNAVTMESAHTAFEFFKKKGWRRETVVVNLSKAADLGGLSIFRANNPVYIIKGVKP